MLAESQKSVIFPKTSNTLNWKNMRFGCWINVLLLMPVSPIFYCEFVSSVMLLFPPVSLQTHILLWMMQHPLDISTLSVLTAAVPIDPVCYACVHTPNTRNTGVVTSTHSSSVQKLPTTSSS